MSTVRELHNQAMALAQQALVARETGALAEAEEFARQALLFEARAAERLANTHKSEPTRSILYRSAAALACQSNDFAMALRLATEGLAGYPPPRIEQELNDLLEQSISAMSLHTDAPQAQSPAAEREQLRGILDFADARDGDSLGLTTADDRTYTLHVVSGFEDVVRTYFKREVTVLADHDDHGWTLVAIQGED